MMSVVLCCIFFCKHKRLCAAFLPSSCYTPVPSANAPVISANNAKEPTEGGLRPTDGEICKRWNKNDLT